MRPSGVRERIEAVGDHERRIVESWSDRRLRVDLRAFLDACALLHYSDHSAVVALRGFRAVETSLADPTQFRTGSDFEARCLAVVDELRPIVGAQVTRPLAELDLVEPALLSVPPRTILGDDGPDRYFDLICWNQANTVAEEVQRPYLAAARISGAGFHNPADRFGLVAPMSELRIRYEDEPGRRPETAGHIVDVLNRFRAAAPWPHSA